MRSTKGIYYDKHFVESNVDSTPSHADSEDISEPSGNEETVNQNGLAECSHLNLIEIPEKCDSVSISTSASPNVGAEDSITSINVLNSRGPLVLHETTPLALDRETPCVLTSTSESLSTEIGTPVGIASSGNTLNLKR